MFLIFCIIMAGPWALQYDLNMWMPYIKTGYQPLGMSVFMFVGGLVLFETAIPIAIITWVIHGLGLI